MKVYICGPMSRLPENNYPAFNAIAADLRRQGHEVENPAENPPPPEGTEDEWSYFMRLSIAQLIRCEAVALLPGWAGSRGACLERQIGIALDMQFYGVEEKES